MIKLTPAILSTILDDAAAPLVAVDWAVTAVDLVTHNDEGEPSPAAFVGLILELRHPEIRDSYFQLIKLDPAHLECLGSQLVHHHHRIEAAHGR